MTPLHYLQFDRSEGDDGVVTLEALASTRSEAQHAAALAEAQAVLDWALQQGPGRPGPIEDGGTWLHELQVQDEAGGWRSLALSVSATPEFAQALLAAFTSADD